MFAGQICCWKSWIGLQDKPSRQWVLNGFSRGVPKQWIHRWPQRCRNFYRGCPEVACSTRNAYSTKKWRLRTVICGEKSFVISDGFPWRTNCFAELKDSHLLIACWTSALIFFGKLLIAGPVLVVKARFWIFNPSGRSFIQFVVNTASSCRLGWARSRKSLISACWRYCGAWSEITFALDHIIQELFGLAQHACVILERMQVAVEDYPNYGRSTWTFFHAKESNDSDIFSEGTLPHSATRSFLNLVPKWENVYHHRFDILQRPCTDGIVAIWLPFDWSFLVVTVGGHHNDLRILFFEIWPETLQ